MDEEQPPTAHTNRSSPNWGLGLAVGIAIGVAIGVAMDNVGMGIAIGVAIGVALAVAFGGAAARPARGDDSAGDDPNGTHTDGPDDKEQP